MTSTRNTLGDETETRQEERIIALPLREGTPLASTIGALAELHHSLFKDRVLTPRQFTHTDQTIADVELNLSGRFPKLGDLEDDEAIENTLDILRAVEKKHVGETDGLTFLTPRAIEIIGKKCSSLYLNNILEISDEDLQLLCTRRKQKISLNGLTKITGRQVDIVTESKCKKLSLNGLRWMSNGHVRALCASHTLRSLSLGGLYEITDVQAEAFAGVRDFLCLEGLGRLPGYCITDAQCKSLAGFRGRNLDLGIPATITDTQLASLMQFERNQLLLWNLREITDAQAEILSEFRGNVLILADLKSITDSQAETLARFRRNKLSLTSVTEISDVQSAAFAGFQGRTLKLGLSTMTDEQARHFATFGGSLLSLTNLTDLSRAQTQTLRALFPSRIEVPARLLHQIQESIHFTR